MPRPPPAAEARVRLQALAGAALAPIIPRPPDRPADPMTTSDLAPTRLPPDTPACAGRRRLGLALATLAAAGPLRAAPAREDPGGLGPWTLQRRDLELRDAPPRGDRPLAVALHGPREAPGRRPLLIVSHGAGGDRDSLLGLAQHLASHGAWVACLEHPGSSLARLRRGGRLRANLEAMSRDAEEVLGRPQDAARVLDLLLGPDSPVPGGPAALDPGRVAALGHSFGAATVLMMAGARVAHEALLPRPPGAPGVGPDLAEPRLRAAIALSPQPEVPPFFRRGSFANLRRPVLGITGSRDQGQGEVRPEDRRAAFRLWGQGLGAHALLWIEDAAHLDFADPEPLRAPALARWAADRPPPSAPWPQDRGRSAVQPLVRVAILAYLREQGLMDAPMAPPLRAEALAPWLGGSVRRVELERR